MANLGDVVADGGAGIAVDQGEGLLYFLDAFGLVVVDLEDGSDVAFLDPPEVADTGAVRDLTLVDGAALLLREDDFVVVPLDDDPDAAGPAAGVTETIDDADALVDDATGAPRALVLAGPDFAFHRSLDDAEPFEGSSGGFGDAAPAATLEPVEGFAYFVRAGRVRTLDLIRTGTTRYDVPELTDPTVVTWGRALAVPTR